MDEGRLRAGELIAGLSGLALLVTLFLPWYGIPEEVVRGIRPQGDLEFAGWEAFALIDLFLALAALSGIALAVLTRIRRSVSLPVALSVATTGLALLATLLLLFRLVNEPGDDSLRELRYGAWLGLLASLGLLAGAWQAMRDEGTGGEEAAARVRQSIQARGRSRPAPPPSGAGAPGATPAGGAGAVPGGTSAAMGAPSGAPAHRPAAGTPASDAPPPAAPPAEAGNPAPPGEGDPRPPVDPGPGPRQPPPGR